ncbi:Maf family protein [Thalassotalea eurytherma]|uniref:7-methyl-GTP pyrophosphatase n=1 Tax=Thalassotalea eurytherma TaxID=1144278 RepID=A0ABQ6H665_9GAMM|nr:Maf family protein [Thalassotalea eurytherma]GLX81936.1 Maf-like protein [Thalassotalea eurytherma]
MKTLVLGSTSPFRKTLLEKLNVPFECAKPNIDETPLVNESSIALVERLAIEKAKAVADQFPNALIIGSDQVALHQDDILGKPHTRENAIKQLTRFSGDKVTFFTGLCVYDNDLDKSYSLVEPFDVYFRTLTHAEICAYIDAEQPLKCAGSFKSEGLGITLFEKLVGDDPNALIGLPLIKLHALLKQAGFDVLNYQRKD